MSILGQKTLVAIDPGTHKCGLVVAERTSRGDVDCLFRQIVKTPDLSGALRELMVKYPISMVVVGNGTASRPLVNELREQWPALGILIVDERETTLEARELYWVTVGRRGWRRLFPSTLQVPPEPYDDFAALVLAHRVLKD